DPSVIPVLTSSYFFFSSRRRHTRFSRDWSSDVCSSDLSELILGQDGAIKSPDAVQEDGDQFASLGQLQRQDSRAIGFHLRAFDRSEERRVGKECRWRWAPEYQRKNRVGRSVDAVTEWSW